VVQLRLEVSPYLTMALSDLDRARDELIAGRVEAGMAELELALGSCRSVLTRPEWFAAATGPLRQHTVHVLLRQDPFTAAAQQFRRGGAGEAHLVDMAMDGPMRPVPQGTSTLGRRIQAVTLSGDTCAGLRWRRTLLADAVRNVAAARPRTRILSVGAGHVREAEALPPEVAAGIAEWVLVDTDAAALATAVARYPGVPLTPRLVSARELITGQLPVDGVFDLVYSPAFFDLITDGMALVLAQRLLERCAHAGRLLVPNATPEASDAGYFEVFLDWITTPRTDTTLLHLLDGAVSGLTIREPRVLRDARGTTVCLDVERV
jgi:SAM-dependent methyltransferase